ncbi:hypothetical protein, partial [Paenibacillus dendritiformis]|uniref:hypothetical protein n=1 Tax=Paenibacillus dendritiformis TaxID=130049 RepID=UPI001A7E1D12
NSERLLDVPTSHTANIMTRNTLFFMVVFTPSNKLLRMSSVYKPVLALNAHLENREQKNAHARIHPPSWLLVIGR